MGAGGDLWCGCCGRPVGRSARETGSCGDPWRSVLGEVTRWAALRVRNRDGDRYALLVAEVEQRNAADLLRAAGWCP